MADGSNDHEPKIARQIRRGDVDHQTWQLFVERLHYWICRRYPFLVHQADDLADETAMRVLVGFPSYRGEANFDHWCYGIARHVVSRHLRKSHGITELSLQDVGDDVPMKDCFPGGLFEWASETAMARLTELERSVFLSRVQHDTDHCEIARRLGISSNASHQTWGRAVKKMRQFAQENGW